MTICSWDAAGRSNVAVWQYDVHVVPRGKLVEVCGSVPAFLHRETFESVDWWSRIEVPDFDTSLSPILALGSSWDPSIITWGQEDSDRVDVLLRNGAVSECFIRIDLRTLAKGVLARILNLVDDWDCLLITPSLRVIEPTVEAIVADVRRSTAWAFVSDPERFFRGLRRPRS